MREIKSLKVRLKRKGMDEIGIIKARFTYPQSEAGIHFIYLLLWFLDYAPSRKL